MELITVGRQYTWNNNHIFSKIGREIVNAEWMQQMNALEIRVLECHCSDHSPLCISFDEVIRRYLNPFKFFNHLMEHEDFIPLIERCWGRNTRWLSMRNVWKDLQEVKRGLRQLNSTNSNIVQTKILQSRQHLKNIQEQMRDPITTTSLFGMEKEIKDQLKNGRMLKKVS